MTISQILLIFLIFFLVKGAVSFTTPLLMPQSDVYSEVDSVVRLMTRWGGIVNVPHDLRVNFARYVAWNNILCLKRYAIQRVFREKRVYGFHPRELYECAFDIVTPNPGKSKSNFYSVQNSDSSRASNDNFTFFNQTIVSYFVSGSLLLDAELLAVSWEVVSELPGLKDLACAFRLNHTALVKAALLHSCVSEDRHAKILSVCSEARVMYHFINCLF